MRRIGRKRVRDALESLSPKAADAEVIAFEKGWAERNLVAENEKPSNKPSIEWLENEKAQPVF